MNVDDARKIHPATWEKVDMLMENDKKQEGRKIGNVSLRSLELPEEIEKKRTELSKIQKELDSLLREEKEISLFIEKEKIILN